MTNLLSCFLKSDTVGRKGGEMPVTYFAGAAIRSSQMPLLLNLVDGEEEEGEKSSFQYFTIIH